MKCTKVMENIPWGFWPMPGDVCKKMLLGRKRCWLVVQVLSPLNRSEMRVWAYQVMIMHLELYCWFCLVGPNSGQDFHHIKSCSRWLSQKRSSSPPPLQEVCQSCFEEGSLRPPGASGYLKHDLVWLSLPLCPLYHL